MIVNKNVYTGCNVKAEAPWVFPVVLFLKVV